MVVGRRREILEAFRIAADGGRDRTAVEELACHEDRLIEQAARIAAQVENVSLQMLAQFAMRTGQGVDDAVASLLVESGDFDHATAANLLQADARRNQMRALQRQCQRLLDTGPLDAENNSA